MARIAAGTVALHDARTKRRWSVDLEPFEIGVFAVTQEQLAELIGESASHPRRPASDVSWLRAIRFCNAASEWEGLDPAYTFEGEDVTWHVDCRRVSPAHRGGVGVRVPCRLDRSALRSARRGRLDERRRCHGTAERRRQAAQPQRAVRHARQRVGVVLGPAGPGALRRVPGVPRGRIRRRRVERAGVDAPWRGAADAPRRRRVPCRAGGFDGADAAQGWSAWADRERAEIDGPLPPGWTPRR